MDSIRKWFYKPKRDDRSLLAQFFYADEALNLVAAELDSFDGRKDPERCTALVNHLRQCQDKVLTICNRIMDDVIPFERADRDFRVKFPDDVMQENLAGQLWFGAECLAAGSSIMNREAESAGMRPLAKAVTKALENVRNQLRERCLRGTTPPDSERLAESLKILDRLFAEFELCYVSAMVPVKTAREYELHQLVVVLFSETLHRALQMHLLSQDMVDAYDPALMFTIPRLAIVSGLLVFPDSPLCLDRTPSDMSEMFRPFRTLLLKIRELLWTLSKHELFTLERLLCSAEDSVTVPVTPEYVAPGAGPRPDSCRGPDLDEFVTRFYSGYPSCEQYVTDFYPPPPPLPPKGGEGEAGSWEDSDDEEEGWGGEEASECDTIVGGGSVASTPLEEGEGGGGRERRKSSLRLNLDGGGEGIEAERCGKASDGGGRNVIQCCSATADEGVVLEDVSGLTKPLPAGEVENLVGSLGDYEDMSDLVRGLRNDKDRFASTEDIDCDDAGSTPSSMLAFADRCSVGSDDRSDPPTPSTSSPSSVSDAIQIRTGFLLANQIAQTSSDSSTPAPPATVACPDSLPDGDSKEAMSAATATLSTLLLLSGESPGSPHDSGLGTIVSCSDSDRSPDTGPTDPDLDRSPPSVDHPNDSSQPSISHPAVSSQLSVGHGDDCSLETCSPDQVSVEPSYRGRKTETLPEDVAEPSPPSTCVRVDSVAVASPAGDDVNLLQPAVPVQSETTANERRRVIQTIPCTCDRVEALPSLPSGPGVVNGGVVRSPAPRNNRRRNERRRNEDNAAATGPDVGVLPGVKAGRARRGERPNSRPTVGGRSYAGNWDSLVKQHSRAGKTRRLVIDERETIGRVSDAMCRVSDPAYRVTYPTCRLPAPSDVLSGSSCSSSCSSCRDGSSGPDPDTDSGSTGSSDTSSFNSDCQDDEEIALAMQAAEIASRNEARSKFRSSGDLVHRLFVCVAGVADQLQTNFAGDLRHILKCVFQINNSVEEEEEERLEGLPAEEGETSAGNDLCRTVESAEEALGWETSPPPPADPTAPPVETPPPWVPDDLAPRCMSCEAAFTVVRRRHHCRNCGKVFCARCSSNAVALPRYGHAKPVRVCNRCFMYQVTPFTIDQIAAHS